METQVSINREAAFVHRCLRLIHEMYGFEAQDRQHMINGLLPLQEDDLLIRPWTLVEDDLMCMINGLAQYLEVNQMKDPRMVQVLAPMLQPLQAGMMTMIYEERAAESPPGMLLEFLGYRRKNNQVWWVHREPTADEQEMVSLMKGRKH